MAPKRDKESVDDWKRVVERLGKLEKENEELKKRIETTMKETKKHELATDRMRKRYEMEIEMPELERKKAVL